ncbi:class I SAM-dependent methyltransferase [Micromonospora echinospora]
MRHAEFEDPRLVAVYDAECRWGPDDDFFLAVVDETPQARVLDLGCGTGRLTLALASAGHRVTGVDPARASLDAARAKPGADRVTWIEGTATLLPDRSFDVAVMTSHVAQFFTTDEEWDAVLADLHRALVPGGRLVFESRDPADRRWERWNPVDSRRHPRLPDGRTVEAWTEVTEAGGPHPQSQQGPVVDEHQALSPRSTLAAPALPLRATVGGGVDATPAFGLRLSHSRPASASRSTP